MKLVRKLAEHYYSWKYRVKRTENQLSAVAVFAHDPEVDNVFAEKVEAMAEQISPCYHTNAQLKAYFMEHYQMQPAELTIRELENEKVYFIFDQCPEVLSLLPMKISEDGQPPTRARFLAWSENHEQLEEEARAYPLEKLPLQVSKYAVRYLHPDDDYTEINVIFEDSLEHYHVSVTGGHSRLSAQGIPQNKAEVQAMIDEIVLAKGVSEEDIRTRSLQFQTYVSRLLQKEVKK